MKKGFFVTFFTLFLVFAFLTGSAFCSAAKQPKEIKIGMSLAITGFFSTEWGQPAVKYMNALESLINEQGGIYVKEYGTRIPVKFIIYDDGSSPDRSVELYEKMATADKVHFFLGPASSPILIKASTVAEKYGIPMVGIEGNSPYIFARGFKWLVGADAPAPDWPISYYNMLKHLMDNKKIPKLNTVAIIQQDNPHTLDLGWGAEHHAKIAGLKVVSNEKVPMRMADFSANIVKLKRAKPDVVYVATFNNLGATLAKQAHEAGFKPFDLHIPHCTLSLPWYKMVGSSIADGLTGMSTTAPYNKGNLKMFHESLNRCGFNLYQFGLASTRFIAAEIYVKAIEKAGTLDRAKVMEAIKGLRYETLYGDFQLVFGKKVKGLTINGMSNKPPYMAQWQKGEIKILWPMDVADGKFIKR
ncbi:amino acid ABC transporter substrate-binding protein [Thermodesulfobacteriota bacterium]